MFTPIDIQNKEFEKATFGYNKNQVEEFVADVARDYERIYKENIELKDRVSTCKIKENMYEQSMEWQALARIWNINDECRAGRVCACCG